MKCIIIVILTILSCRGKISASTTTNFDDLTSMYAAECRLRLVDETFRDRLDVLLASGVKMIDYDLMFRDYGDVLENKGGVIYKWNHWIKTINNRGRSLLMLDDKSELLSLNTMKIGVKQIKVTLYDEPPSCLGNLSLIHTIDLIRTTVLNDFKLTSPSVKVRSPLDPDQHICNMYVKNANGYALFLYTCCLYDENQELRCTDVQHESWMSVLKVFVTVIKVLIVLFCPLLIPERFYRKKFTETEYHYHVSKDESKVQLNIVMTQNPERYTSENKAVKIGRLQDMQYFTTMLSIMRLDTIYEMNLDTIRLLVSRIKLLEENSVPVGFFRYFYNNICKCKLRNANAFASCCQSSICGTLKFGVTAVTWFKCLRPCMMLLQLVLLTLPWITRIIVYIIYEHSQEIYKAKKVDELGLKLSFLGNFATFLTPFHSVFLFCYILLLMDAVIYGTISQAVKLKLKMVATASLRDMREISKLNVCSWMIGIALTPFKTFGLLGILLVVLYWIVLSPIFILLFVFYFIPIVNLTTRMMIQLLMFLCPNSLATTCNKWMIKLRPIAVKLSQLKQDEHFQEKDELSKKGLLFQYVIIIICIVSMWSITFLVMECISFFVEMALYTTIGIIINAGVALKYISVVSLLILYSRECFGKLHKKYLSFIKVIFGQLLTREKTAIEKTARSDAEYQENTVFRVKGEATNIPDIKLTVKDDAMKWTTAGLLLFLNHEDKPFIPEKFFLQVIEMKYHGCPGPIHYNIIRTLVEFAKIIMFIIFIVIVVMAFGDVYSISSTNQMIATGAGGLLPYAVKHFFAKKTAPIINVESLQFKSEFNKALERFQQTWPVFDIFPEKYQMVNLERALDDVVANTVDDTRGNNNNDDKPVSEFTTLCPTLTTDTSVDLIVDMSNFRGPFKDKYNKLSKNGSATMLADTYGLYEV